MIKGKYDKVNQRKIMDVYKNLAYQKVKKQRELDDVMINKPSQVKKLKADLLEQTKKDYYQKVKNQHITGLQNQIIQKAEMAR